MNCMPRSWIKRIRDRVLFTEDSVCLERARLVTEAYPRDADDPVPLKRAKAFARVLQHMTLDLDTNPIFSQEAGI
jgi:pyruvate-formate lyase